MVEAIQRALTTHGFDPGNIDGAMGWRTRGALRVFQRSVGLPDTGRADSATLTALGLGPRTGAHPEPEAGTDTQQAEAPRAEPDTTPGSDSQQPEAPRAEPMPEHTVRPRLSFTMLRWHPPQTGAEALARFNATGAPPEFKRGKDSLFVPKGELVFVLKTGERIPGLHCDPGAGRLSIEFVFDPDGPLIFTPIAGGEYCQVGIGIALEVGRTLDMRRVDWGDVQYPRGTVRITARGLEYVR